MQAQQGGVVSLETNLKQVTELIRRNYQVPVFAEVTINSDPSFHAPHISLKDVMLPILKDYETAKKREAYLIDIVNYFVGRGVMFTYLDNPAKQKFVNEIREVIPEIIDVRHYPPDSPSAEARKDET